MNVVRNFFYQISLKERSPYILALSFCLGAYIAFSPFLLLHTAMCIGIAFLFGLNIAVTLAASMMINNPWTAVPIYVTDYIFGHWLVHSVLHYGERLYVPQWLGATQAYIGSVLGIDAVCFWSFMIGGNVLGIGVALLLYPGILKLSRTILKENNPLQETV